MGRIRRCAGIARAGLILLLAVLACVCPVDAQEAPLPIVKSNPFQDLPPNHPAYAAIDQLVRLGIIEGYPDGSFRGGKVITRYDLALMMARAQVRVQQLQAQGRPISPQEQQLIDKLQREVGVELGLLGVRTDSLERRIQASEQRADNLDLRKSNVTIGGFYRLENSYVMEPVDFSEYPFQKEINPFFLYRDRGLLPLRQEFFLRFAGRPVIDGLALKNIDAFAEVRGLLIGNAGLYPTYNFSPQPARLPTFAGDNLDDLSTGVTDEARVFFNRAHFRTRTKNLNFRTFANESATDLTDPNVLFTVDTLAPFSGFELDGSISKFGYTSSVLRDIQLRSPTGIDPRDITSFDQESKRTSDVYTLRLQYEPYKYGVDVEGKRLVLGFTYVEHAFRYDVVNDFFRTMAWDVGYTRTTEGRLDATLSGLISQAFPDRHDIGLKFDFAYQKDGFLANLKAYTFGHDFRTDLAQNQFVDTDVSFNFHRQATPGLPRKIAGLPDPSNRGEQLMRLQLRNDWQGKDLKSLRNLVLSALWELKSWERDPENALFNDDENGSRFYVQAIADMTERWRVEMFSEIQKDVRLDLEKRGILDAAEEGTITNTFRSDWRALQGLSFVTEFQFKDDLDSLNLKSDHFKMFRQKYELAWQAHPRFFLKPTFELIENSDLQLTSLPVDPINGRRINRKIIETNWVALPKWSIKNLWVIQKTENDGLLAPSQGKNIPIEDNNSNVIITENLFNFTPSLKVRYIYAWQNTHLFNTGVDPLHLKDLRIANNFLEVLYIPSASTEVRATFGNEFENPNDPFDNGPAKFFSTEKVFQIKAQTDF